MSDIKKKVYTFASLNKLVKFNNADPKTEGMNLSVTVSGSSKLRFNVYNKNNNVSAGWGFYIIDFIPWLKGIIKTLEAGTKVDAEIAGTINTNYDVKAGSPTNGKFAISYDEEGPYIRLQVNTVVLPKWRFPPLPNIKFFSNGDIDNTSSTPETRLLAWLVMLEATVTSVSDYVAAVEANSWSPPDEEAEYTSSVEAKNKADSTAHKAKGATEQGDFDDDIPF